ncbi:thiosulfate oxidation carrier protein SoxY [Pararhodobacter sp. SW119]|uniref:thiosulfate oxidation carrier protein SoxY n=1 Tax=Pararhodobacter sp. SW119 TaxID=2780075 RepID=UPI001ADFAB16|nr:thiosulfate oxidation carrier protein SoxY [Pararhodobacter sp. SW119]
MELTRRRTLALGAAALTVTLLPIPASAAVDAQELVERYTGGVNPGEGPLQLTAPAVAENGSAVAIEVACPGARSIRILAPANPTPDVCAVHFGPLAGEERLSTRIRMADTMDLIALAEMDDGSFVQATARVSVTVGGCR